MTTQAYDNPLISRYSSGEMSELFGPQRKFRTWRQLWIALAESQQQLGLEISDEQLVEMRSAVDEIDFDAAAQYERKLRHDVMAHVHAFGDACPSAKKIIHLGATSCYVTDNTDLILFRDALRMVAVRLAGVIDALAQFAARHRALACLGFTHLQPAQPTTVGKRACLWAHDLALDLAEIESRIASLPFRSTQGTTGTQASFLKLFDRDEGKVETLNRLVTERMGFDQSVSVSGQTYTRKFDSQILDALSGVSQSAHKIGNDLRILASRREMEEPFEEKQIGSSAMAYKRNPMRSERVCALARFVISLQSSTANTLATQWMERTLDDSANRRLVIPQAFLAVDAILILLQNIAQGLVVYPAVIARNLSEEIQLMATENILMAAVEKGGDRQRLHESIRQHSLRAVDQFKDGGEMDLIPRLKSDPDFAQIDFDELTDPLAFVGLAPQQVDRFIATLVEPIRTRYANREMPTAEIKV